MNKLIDDTKEEGLPRYLEIKTVKLLHEKKKSLKEIARAIKSTQEYAKDLLIEAGLIKVRTTKMIQWKTKEEHIYNQLVQNFTYGEIAERMGVPNPQNKAQGMGSYINKNWGSKQAFLDRYKPKHQQIAADKKEEIDKEKIKQEKMEINRMRALLALIKMDYPELYTKSEQRMTAVANLLK